MNCTRYLRCNEACWSFVYTYCDDFQALVHVYNDCPQTRLARTETRLHVLLTVQYCFCPSRTLSLPPSLQVSISTSASCNFKTSPLAKKTSDQKRPTPYSQSFLPRSSWLPLSPTKCPGQPLGVATSNSESLIDLHGAYLQERKASKHNARPTP